MMITEQMRHMIRKGRYGEAVSPSVSETLLNEVEKLEADLAAATERNKALEAENKRLRKALRDTRAVLSPMPEANAYCEAQLDFIMDQKIDAIVIIDEALQAKEAE